MKLKMYKGLLVISVLGMVASAIMVGIAVSSLTMPPSVGGLIKGLRWFTPAVITGVISGVSFFILMPE